MNFGVGLREKHRGLLERLAKRRIQGEVVVMPDFFVDRFVRLGSITEVFSMLRRKASSGGGSVHGFNQFDVKGGNAVNTAYALGRLGVSTRLITMADRGTLWLLKVVFEELPNVRLKVVEGRPGYTIALEFARGRKRVNVMLSDVGDVAAFGSERLSDEEWKAVSEANVTAIFNWAANTRGTELASEVFAFAKEKGRMTFFDPADITVKGSLFEEFLDEVPKKDLLDVLSINENEARVIAKLLGRDQLPIIYNLRDVKRTTSMIAENLKTTIDVHTPNYSCSCSDGDLCYVQSFRVEQINVTGAGDVWDAADIAGYLMGLDPVDRLTFANASAAFYVSDHDVRAPTLDQVADFLRQN